MSEDITEFNLNDILNRTIIIINKSKTFIDIVNNNTISKRKKLRILRLLNIYPTFSETLKAYTHVKNSDYKTYLDNIINHTKELLHNKHNVISSEKQTEMNEFIKELNHIFHSENDQKGGSATTPASEPTSVQEPIPSPTPASEPSPTPASEPSPTPASEPSPTPASEPSPTLASEPTPTTSLASPPTPAQEPISEVEKLIKDELNLLGILFTKRAAELDDLILNKKSLYDIYKTNTEYNHVYKHYTSLFDEDLKKLSDEDSAKASVLLSLISNDKFISFVRGFTYHLPRAQEKFKGNPLLIFVNTLKSTVYGITDTISSSGKGVVTFNGAKDLIATVISVIVDCTGVGAAVTGTSTAVGAVGLTNIVPLLIFAGQIITPLAIFFTLVMMKQDKDAMDYLIEQVSFLQIFLNVIHMCISSIHKIANVNNMKKILDMKSNETIIHTQEEVLNSCYINSKAGQSIDIDEIYKKLKFESEGNVDIITNASGLITDIILCNMKDMFGLETTLMLIAIFERLDTTVIKEQIEKFKKDISCPDHPLNKFKRFLSFIFSFINNPIEAIFKPLLDIMPESIKNAFYIRSS